MGAFHLFDQLSCAFHVSSLTQPPRTLNLFSDPKLQRIMNGAVDLPTLFDPTTCTRKGLCPVSSIRNKGDPFESHSLYFEQHGTGPEKIVFIMG